MVIADADVWIDFFKGARTTTSDILQELVEAGQILLTGVVLAEVIRGARDDHQRRQLEELLALPYLEMQRDVWQDAGRLASQLDAKGERVALPDLILAAVSLAGDHHLLTRDKHFARIPGLKLYKREEAADA